MLFAEQWHPVSKVEVGDCFLQLSDRKVRREKECLEDVKSTSCQPNVGAASALNCCKASVIVTDR